MTGICPVCLGRFRLAADVALPHHAPATNVPKRDGQHL
jgi:hypothetical protein